MSKFICIIGILQYSYMWDLLFYKFEALHVNLYKRITELKSRNNTRALQGLFICPKNKYFLQYN